MDEKNRKKEPRMPGRIMPGLALAGALTMIPAMAGAEADQGWNSHSMSRPHPTVVTPPEQHLPAPAPADAVVLFDGRDLSQWRNPSGTAAKWRVRDGVMETVGGSGPIQTVRPFGDVQLHLEWATPVPAAGQGQGRGNSGVYFMGLYEIQVLDSFQSDTYADGQAAAIYGQAPPLFNASRRPGEWQTYDIYFRRPRFDASGALLQPARVTVVHNGILVQNNMDFNGPTAWLQQQPYQAHADKLPLTLQDHSNPVRFRNIWVRELPEPQAPTAAQQPVLKPVTFSSAVLDRYAGDYKFPGGGDKTTITRAGDQLMLQIGPARIPLIPLSETEFALKGVDSKVVFTIDSAGVRKGYTLHIGGDRITMTR